VQPWRSFISVHLFSILRLIYLAKECMGFHQNRSLDIRRKQKRRETAKTVLIKRKSDDHENIMCKMILLALLVINIILTNKLYEKERERLWGRGRCVKGPKETRSLRALPCMVNTTLSRTLWDKITVGLSPPTQLRSKDDLPTVDVVLL